MADLTAARNDKREEGDLIDAKFGSNTIYAGSLVCVDSNGNAVKGDNAKAFLGVAVEDTATAIAERRDYIRIWVKGEFEFNKASAAATDLGKRVTVGANDNTVALATEGTTAENLIIGKITKVDTTNNLVRVVLRV